MNVDQQRITKFSIEKKKKEKGQKSETVLKQFTQFILKKIVINPTESVQINKETIVNLPDGIHA